MIVIKVTHFRRWPARFGYVAQNTKIDTDIPINSIQIERGATMTAQHNIINELPVKYISSYRS